MRKWRRQSNRNKEKLKEKTIELNQRKNEREEHNKKGQRIILGVEILFHLILPWTSKLDLIVRLFYTTYFKFIVCFCIQASSYVFLVKLVFVIGFKKTDGQRDEQTERQIDKLRWFACYLRRNQMGVKSASVSCSRFFVASYLNPSSYFPFKRHYLKCCEDKYDVELNNVHFVADSLKVILMKLLTKTIFSFN